MKHSNTMTSLLFSIVMASSLVGALPANAKSQKHKKDETTQTGKVLKTSVKSTGKGRYSQDIVFSGSSVDGRYHAAGEAVTKVEPEKKMNDLIGMRRDFKDRLAAEKERLKQEQAATAETTAGNSN